MEFVPGGPLLDYLRARKRLHAADAARLLGQLVSGLDYCHRKSVVHRRVWAALKCGRGEGLDFLCRCKFMMGFCVGQITLEVSTRV